MNGQVVRHGMENVNVVNRKEEQMVKVCVTGGSGYVASWLIKKLLEKDHIIVHATLRNLDDLTKVGLLKSLPNADTRLVLFKADIFNPKEFEPAIEGCQFVFHVANPMLQYTEGSQFEESIKANIAGVKSIADYCISSKTVKRLIYTGSIMASSPLKDDGSGFKATLDESCWTPLNLLDKCNENYMQAYAKNKTLSEKEILSYNEIGNGSLEVVSLACGLIGGDTILSYLPSSVDVILSQLTGDFSWFKGLKLLEELLGSVPLVHIDDICEAHIFCMEQQSIKGRFICVAEDPTIKEVANYYCKNYPQFKISEEFKGGPERGSKCKNTKLVNEGFRYKYDLNKILDGSVDCGRRLGKLCLH